MILPYELHVLLEIFGKGISFFENAINSIYSSKFRLNDFLPV